MTTTRTLDAPPSLGLLYGKAALAAVLPGGADTLPDEVVTLPQVDVDREHLARYQRVCGFRLSDRLPATYLHVVGFPLAVDLMARREFPFALPGLVHVANRIEHLRVLTVADRPQLTVRITDLRAHPKGEQFDIVATASLGDEPVWVDTSTYLHRGSGEEGATTPGPATTLPDQRDAAHWQVPSDTGRRYAAVSGDRNPIHLNPVTAKLFGFPRQIAHGMWTKARALAGLQGRLPDAFTVDVGFKKPLVVPAEVRFSTQRSGDGWRFSLHDHQGDAPHLAGEVTPS